MFLLVTFDFMVEYLKEEKNPFHIYKLWKLSKAFKSAA